MKIDHYQFNKIKNLTLLSERGICFYDIITILDTEGAYAVINHPNQEKYPGQKIYVVILSEYAYLVPFKKIGQIIFLKTIYPSRKMTRAYQYGLLEELCYE